MEYLFKNKIYKVAILLLVISGLFLYYLNYDDGVYYVYKDDRYPFKTYPDNVITEVKNDLNVHTKIVYPNNEVNTDYEIVDQSFLDGSELDRAEQSLSFEYDENIIEYASDDDFILETLELLEAQSPSSQTYGIYEKQPILKEFVVLDNDFVIKDENYLLNYDWPGNVRELRNLVERIAILSPGNDEEKILNIIKESLSKNTKENFSVADNLAIPLREARENFEKEYLMSQINKFGGNISKTAKFVGMERSALHRKLKGLGIKEFN